MLVKGLIFDFDGVLVDSFAAYYAINVQAAQSIGRSLSPDEYRGWFTDSVRSARRAYVGDPAAHEQFLAAYRSAREIPYAQVGMFPGAVNCVRKLAAQLPLAIASITTAELIRQHLQHNGIADCFVSVLGTGRSQSTKAVILQESRTSLGTTAEQTAFVTDTVSDVHEGHALGLRSIAVTWGFHDRATLAAAKPAAIVDSFAALMAVLGAQP